MTKDVLARWESVLTRLAEDPMQLSGELDWVAKLELLEGYRTRDNLPWSHPRLQLVDLQYSDIRPDRGLYNRLVARGRMQRLVSEEEVQRAIENPPTDTRAYFRGRCLRQYSDSVAAASWDSVIFDIPGRESLQRVPTLEPLRGTKAHVGELLDRCRHGRRARRRPDRRGLIGTGPAGAVPTGPPAAPGPAPRRPKGGPRAGPPGRAPSPVPGGRGVTSVRIRARRGDRRRDGGRRARATVPAGGTQT